jgi:hypothetical protein
MTASTTDYAVDRLDDDGAPIRLARDGDQRAARLVWAPATAGRRLDGAWWPHTRDAATELVALVPLVSEHLGGPVNRVSLNIDAWDPHQPRHIWVGNAHVRLGWFHTLDPTTVTLGRGTEDRRTLLVLPPGLDQATARRLLRPLSAGTPLSESSISELGGASRGNRA